VLLRFESAMRLLMYIAVVVLALTPRTSGAQSLSNVVPKWNSVEVQAIRDSNIGAPMVSRALAIVHTCMYDAWAAYDDHAEGTQLAGVLRRPPSERTLANKEKRSATRPIVRSRISFRAILIPSTSRS